GRGEVPLLVDVFRTDSTGRRNVRAVGVGSGWRSPVVAGRLQLVFEYRVVQEPEEELSVAAGHQHGEAAGQLTRCRLSGRDLWADPDDVQILEHCAHDRDARPGSECRGA